MKKIKIIDSNNQYISLKQNIDLHDLESHEMVGLREYVQSKVKLETYAEPEIFFQTMNWVHSQWNHNGLNSAPSDMSSLEILHRAEAGEHFRCVEYAKVTADVLNSFGYAARMVNIISHDADYGGAGKGHMATEVWSNTLDKWIYLDPQFNIYATNNGIPLNYFEIYRQFKEADFIYLTDGVPKQKREEKINTYKNFVSNYFGYVSTFQTINEMKIRLSLHLDNPNQQLAFQYIGLNHVIYTKNIEDFYFSLNHTLLIFEFKDQVDVHQLIKERQITNAEELKNNAHLFAAIPSFKLKFVNNMAWFDHYEVQLNDEIIHTRDDSLDWELNDGINDIQVFSVNQLGIKGAVTKMKISYQ